LDCLLPELLGTLAEQSGCAGRIRLSRGHSTAPRRFSILCIPGVLHVNAARAFIHPAALRSVQTGSQYALSLQILWCVKSTSPTICHRCSGRGDGGEREGREQLWRRVHCPPVPSAALPLGKATDCPLCAVDHDNRALSLNSLGDLPSAISRRFNKP